LRDFGVNLHLAPMRHTFYLTALSHGVFLTFWNITPSVYSDSFLARILLDKRHQQPMVFSLASHPF